MNFADQAKFACEAVNLLISSRRLNLIAKLREEEGCHSTENDAEQIDEYICNTCFKGWQDHQCGSDHKSQNAMGGDRVKTIKHKLHQS